jgi:cytochrome P450
VQTAALMRDPHGFFTRLHARHGWAATIRILGEGQVVCVADPDWAKAMFSDPDGLRAGQAANTLEPIVGPASLLTLDGSEHLRQRKLLLPPFHGDMLRGYEDTVRDIAAREAESWPVGTTFALHAAMQRATLEMILRVVFGVTDDQVLARFVALLEPMIKLANVAVLPPRLRTDRGGRFTPGGRFHAALREFDDVIADQIARRRGEGDDHAPDVLGLLLAARDEDGNGLTDDELRDELVTLLVAGHETTATSMAWTLDLLLHDEPAFAAARDAAHRGDGAYLEAVGKEALRLRPVIFSSGRITQQETTILGWTVPAKTRLWAPLPVLHRDPTLWDEPEAWRPERFLDGSPVPYSWLPFGGGVRRCIGAAFALMEMRVLLQEILTRVELRADGPLEPAALRNVVATPKHGVRVTRIS